jgi:tRNA-modifying protein YgfZ
VRQQLDQNMTSQQTTSLDNRAILTLTGTDVVEFLQNLITNDMAEVTDSHAIYAALLTAQGKFLHDFFVIKWGDEILLDVAADRKADLLRRLTMYKLRADVTIADGAYDITARFGDTPDGAAGTVTKTGDSLQYVDPRLPAMGTRILTPHDNKTTAAQVSYAAYEAHRLALGIPEGGADIIPEKNFLLEANFEELNGVSFSKGCYVGQELTARTKHRAKIKKRLFQIRFDGELTPGQSITRDGKEIAEVRSVQNGHGLALTRLDPLQDGSPQTTEPAGIVFTKPAYLKAV